MNLRWNPDLRRFEVEFHNFTEEQPLVKAVGFKTDGPPAWVWYSYKSEPLTKLREKKPATLTINPDARTEYLALKEVEDRNAAVKAQMKENAKALKKKLKIDKQDAMRPDEYLDEETGMVCLRVLPSTAAPFEMPKSKTPIPSVLCFICEEPVFEYEYGEGHKPSCLWCQKIVLDSPDVL